MEHIRLTAISLSLLLCTVSAFAQRHYENIPALELNYGTNLFGNAGNYYNLSFSRYINRTSYWKAGFSYFEKPYEYTANLPQVSTLNPEETIPETIHDKGKDFFLTSSLRTPKIFIKEFGDFLMSCHQHCLGVNLLVQR